MGHNLLGKESKAKIIDPFVGNQRSKLPNTNAAGAAAGIAPHFSRIWGEMDTPSCIVPLEAQPLVCMTTSLVDGLGTHPTCMYVRCSKGCFQQSFLIPTFIRRRDGSSTFLYPANTPSPAPCRIHFLYLHMLNSHGLVTLFTRLAISFDGRDILTSTTPK